MGPFLTAYRENGNIIVCAVYEWTSKVYTVDIEEFYGTGFACKSVARNKRNGTFAVSLKADLPKVTCPFCGGSLKKIQKAEKRKIFDLLELDEERDGGEMFDTAEDGIIAVKVTYDNFTYRCKAPSCGRLYKNECKFLSENPKSPLSSRAVQVIRDLNRDGYSPQYILKVATARVWFPLSKSTVYAILKNKSENPGSMLLPSYVLLENKNA